MSTLSAEQLRTNFPHLFGGTPLDKLAPVVARLRARSLPAGAALFQRGVPSPELVLVVAGRLAASVTESGKKLELSDAGPGDWVGDIGFIDRGGATADVVATEASELLVLSADAFESLCTEDPRAARDMLHAICTRLSARVRRSARLLHEQGVSGSWRSAPLDEPPSAATGSMFDRLRHALFKNS